MRSAPGRGRDPARNRLATTSKSYSVMPGLLSMRQQATELDSFRFVQRMILQDDPYPSVFRPQLYLIASMMLSSPMFSSA